MKALPYSLLLVGLLIGLLSGCERARQDMYDQPRYKTFGASTLFPDGATARTPPEGTQARARGGFADSTGGRKGTAEVAADIAAGQAQANPYPVDQRLLERGRERYMIYCMPCHSPLGDGDGLVVRRGFPAPPSFHQDRLRDAPDRHIYDVITQGYGVMAPYADRVEPVERWAIVAFIRALQLSQHAQVDSLPPALRAKLDAQPGGAP
jgi:mono/diheme cytochrome c family protein